MSDLNIKKIIEALLFVSEKPLSIKQIIQVCPEVEPQRLKVALKELKELYGAQDRGIQIREVAGGFQFSSNPDCAEYLKKLYKTRRVFRLSAPALETLAIIAYKQPVTRAEIEFIRGVNVDGVVKTLEDRELIKVKGRKEVPGRPLIYGTTEIFLHYFGLKSLQDLPTLEEFTAQNLSDSIQELEDDKHSKPDEEERIASEETSNQQTEFESANDDFSNPNNNINIESSQEKIKSEGLDNPEGKIVENKKEGDERNEHKETTKSN